MLCEWTGSTGVECSSVCTCGELAILKTPDPGPIPLLGGLTQVHKPEAVYIHISKVWTDTVLDTAWSDNAIDNSHLQYPQPPHRGGIIPSMINYDYYTHAPTGALGSGKLVAVSEAVY